VAQDRGDRQREMLHGAVHGTTLSPRARSHPDFP